MTKVTKVTGVSSGHRSLSEGGLKSCILLILISSLVSCTQNKGQIGSGRSSNDMIKKEIISIAENYARDQLKAPKQDTLGNGTVIISDEQKKYVIEPSKIFVGLIDDDSSEDAIITITSYRGEDLDLIEHLFIMNTNGKLMLIRSIESDMRILQLKDRIITAELPTKPRSSPLYNCAHCQEIVKYQFKNGDLIRLK